MTKKILTPFLIIIYCSSYSWGQIEFQTIAKVVILDYVNWNYQSVNSVEYEIDFKNDFTLSKTGRISKAQFVREKFKHQQKSLDKKKKLLENKFYIKNDSSAREKSKFLSKKFWAKIDLEYEKYYQNLKPKKLFKLDSLSLQKLIDALNSPPTIKENYYPLEKWLNQNKSEIKTYLIDEKLLPFTKIDSLVNSYTYEAIPNFELLDTMIVQIAENQYRYSKGSTSYYPIIGITIFTTNGDTLHFENSSQVTPPLPWVLCTHQKKEFNSPNINFALFEILPKNSKINRKRLNPSIKYPKIVNPVIQYFAHEIIKGKTNKKNSR